MLSEQRLELDLRQEMKTENDIVLRHDLINLLRETLPYLQSIELGTRTSIVLRSLIADIKMVTDKNDEERKRTP